MGRRETDSNRLGSGSNFCCRNRTEREKPVHRMTLAVSISATNRVRVCMCACVRLRAHARACVCVCVCVRACELVFNLTPLCIIFNPAHLFAPCYVFPLAVLFTCDRELRRVMNHTV